MLDKKIKYNCRNRLFRDLIFTLLLVCLLFGPTPSNAQGSGAFTALVEIQDADFGVWSGAELVGGSIIPVGNDGFCILYQRQILAPELMRVNYELELTGPSSGNDYVLQSSGGNLPVSFRMSPAAGSTISFSGAPGADLVPASVYQVTFPNAATSIFNLFGDNFISPGGCNDARFDFEISISSADVIALADPTNTFSSNFQIQVYSPGWLNFIGGDDLIDFNVSIAIESSVYIDQLSETIDLNSQTRENFCLWSFDGSSVNLTADSANPGSFTLENRDDGGVLVDSIPYTLRLRSLYNGSRSTLTNGIPVTGLVTESAASGGVNCGGSQGLNYRLIFNVSDSSGKAAGDYTDRITLTVEPN